MKEHAGIPVFTSILICEAFNPISVVMSWSIRLSDGNLQISHHTGALSFASLDQIMVLTATVKVIRSNHRAKTMTPVFHDLLAIWNSGMTMRAQAMKFAMGTSGYVGSIFPAKRWGRITFWIESWREQQGEHNGIREAKRRESMRWYW